MQYIFQSSEPSFVDINNWVATLKMILIWIQGDFNDSDKWTFKAG